MFDVYKFSKTYQISKEVDLEKIAEILDEVIEEATTYIYNQLNLRLLTYPIEAEIRFINNTKVEVILTISLAISPLSPESARSDRIAMHISEIFFKKFGDRIRREVCANKNCEEP